jgi:hypothetical protein
MASSIYITDASGTNYHLAGSGTSYTGTGTPWTAQATSPYQLAMNDVTGPSYTPQAAAPLEIFNGGPPFRVGADLNFRGYGNVTETFGLQMYASSHNNAVALLRTLRRALSTTLASNPPILVVQPDGATNAIYYEVYGAHIQELPAFINEEAGVGTTKILRALITWTRSPLGGGLSAGETLINGATVTNTGTGTPDNLESLGTSGTGEFVYEGGPLNVTLAGAASADSCDLILATCAGRTYINRSDSLITSSTVGVSAATLTSAITAANFVANRHLKLRILARVTGASSNLQLVVRLSATAPYDSPWITVAPLGGSGNALLDFGGVALPAHYRTLHTGAAQIDVSVRARSTTGAATTGTLDYVELIPYYTWGIAKGLAGSSGDDDIAVETFVQRSGAPALPIPARASSADSGTFTYIRSFIGRAPVYISGASLYVAWRDRSTNAHDATDTATLTVTHAPLFHTLRGGG